MIRGLTTLLLPSPLPAPRRPPPLEQRGASLQVLNSAGRTPIQEAADAGRGAVAQVHTQLALIPIR